MPTGLIWGCETPETGETWHPIKVGPDGKLQVDISETALDAGVTTGGTITTLIDTTKDWEINMHEDCVLEVTIGGIEYHRTIVSNTDDTLTFNALPGGVVVAAGDTYEIRTSGRETSGVVHIDSFTGTGNIVVASTVAGAFTARKVSIHWSVATNNPVTISLDAAAGAAYDVVLRTAIMVAGTDLICYFPDGAMFVAGDVIAVGWTDDSGGASVWGVQIGLQE